MRCILPILILISLAPPAIAAPQARFSVTCEKFQGVRGAIEAGRFQTQPDGISRPLRFDLVPDLGTAYIHDSGSTTEALLYRSGPPWIFIEFEEQGVGLFSWLPDQGLMLYSQHKFRPVTGAPAGQLFAATRCRAH